CLDAGGFETYIFNHPILIVDYNKVPHLKRFIKKYHEIIEDVPYDILRGKRNGDPSYTQAGDYRCHILSPIVQQEQDTDGPDEHIDDDHNAIQLFHFLLATTLMSDIVGQ